MSDDKGALFNKGLKIRREVLGHDHVDRSLNNATEFSAPLQNLVTEYCWGAVWGREALPRKTRSLLNLAMLAALNRPHELKLHLRAAGTNGCTMEEIREVMLQVMIYCGVPAAIDFNRLSSEVFAELESQPVMNEYGDDADAKT